jgi:rhamnose transport system permease protein
MVVHMNTKKLLKKRESYIFFMTVILWIAISTTNLNFAHPAYLLELIGVNSVYFICALGVLPLMIKGHFDLSMGGIIALTSVILSLMTGYILLPIPILIFLGAFIGGLIGVVNGSLIAKFKVSSVVVTLATMYIFYGISKFIHQTFLGNFFMSDGYMIQDYYGAIENVSVLLMALTTFFVLKHTQFGRSVYAFGGDRKLAMQKGYRESVSTIRAHGFSGLSAGISAALHLITFNQTSVDAYMNIEFELIIIVILGGLHILGGYGTVFGTLIASLFIIILRSGLVFARIPVFWHDMMVGGIIIGVIAYGVLKDRVKKRYIKVGET